MEDYEVVYGIHPVEEIINSGKQVKRICIKKTDTPAQKIQQILLNAQVKNIPIKYLKDQAFQELQPDANTQGIIAYIKRETKHTSIDYNKNFYLILDHITDVHNIGAVLRSADFFNVDGVILPKQRSADLHAVMSKTSAGASAYIKIIQVPNLVNEIEQFKKHNFWIVGADVHGKDDIYTFKPPKKSVIVMGNEEKGISRLIKDKLDFKIKIPSLGHLDSLNVSVATALFLFQYRRYFK